MKKSFIKKLFTQIVINNPFKFVPFKSISRISGLKKFYNSVYKSLPFYKSSSEELIDLNFRDRMRKSQNNHEYADLFSEKRKVNKIFFDEAYYLNKYQDVKNKNIDPFIHFINYGIIEGRKPSPFFYTRSLLEEFKKKRIFKNLSIRRSFIRLSKRNSIPSKYFCYDEVKLIDQNINNKFKNKKKDIINLEKDIRDRLVNGNLGNLIEKASLIEEKISFTWPKCTEIKIPGIQNENVILSSLVSKKLFKFFKNASCKYCILVNKKRWGFGKKEEGYFFQFLSEKIDKKHIFVIYTEGFNDECHFRFSDLPEQNIIDFYTPFINLEKNYKIKLLFEFIRLLNPNALFNINSQLCWDMFDKWGIQLKEKLKIYSYLFCGEKDLNGFMNGYPYKYFDSTFEFHEEFITDSSVLKKYLINKFKLKGELSEKIRFVKTPINNPINKSEKITTEKFRVYWAGRLDHQKRPDILSKIAAKLPQFEFFVWGKPIVKDWSYHLKNVKNINYMGVYSNIYEINFSKKSAWLYTSEWDGFPHILLEVALLKIPICSSYCGGISDELNNDNSYIVRNLENIDEYVENLIAISREPEKAHLKAENFYKRIMKERSYENFSNSLDGIIK